MTDFELPVDEFWNEDDQRAQIERDYIRPAIDDEDRFDREARAILDKHLTAAISAAEAEISPMPSSLIHAIVAAALKACRRTADAYMKENHDLGPGVDDVIAERKSYLMLEEVTKSVLELASLPGR